GVAGVLGGRDVVGEFRHALERGAVLVVLEAHHRDRPLALWQLHATLQHREQDLFFLEHVAFQFLLHVPEMLGEPHRTVGLVAMNLLDPIGQAYQLGELFAVPLMKALENVLDERAGRLVAPIRLRVGVATQGGELLGNGLRIEGALAGGVAQAGVTTAAEIQLVLAENTGGSRDEAGQVAQGLLGQCNGHGWNPELSVCPYKSKGCASFNSLSFQGLQIEMVKITDSRYGSKNPIRWLIP